MKTDSSPGHPAYRADIDGLRAIAILSVLGYHAFPSWVPGGFIGVDIFFVISGFLISSILLANLQNDRFSLVDFYSRRIRRIFPALILVLLASLIVGFFILWPGEYRGLGKYVAGGAGFLVNAQLWGESGYFDESAETKPLLHLWSLGVEEQFYIFWPLMLLAAWKWKHHAGVMIFTTLALSFVANIWLVEQNQIFDFYSPFSRFWELMTGGALAWAAQRKVLPVLSISSATILSMIGIGLILGAIYALDKDMDFPGWYALLPVAGACLILFAGEVSCVNKYMLGSRPMVGIGLISYPLYLWHWPLLSFAQILSGEMPNRTVRCAMVVLSVLLATATYKFIENPIRRGALTQRQILILLATLFILGSTGALVWVNQGLPQRYADGGVAAQALDGDRLIETWQQNVRMHECHIQDDSDQRGPDCIEQKRPLLLLWGDSHAAALYPGLKHLQMEHKFGIAQLTQAGCPPVFNVPRLTFRKNCNELNQQIFAQAKELQPAVILLSAAWHHHDYPMEDSDMIAHLVKAVAQIKQALPQSHVIVVGPDPRWLSPLPSIYRRALTVGEVPPPYSQDHLDPAMQELDARMKKALTAQGDEYLSSQAQLCDERGCLTRLGEGIDGIAFIDEEHVTTIASEFLAEKFAPTLLDRLGLKN